MAFQPLNPEVALEMLTILKTRKRNPSNNKRYAQKRHCVLFRGKSVDDYARLRLQSLNTSNELYILPP